jgi:hypothetical protein
MLQFRKVFIQPTPKLGIGSEVVVTTQYRKYYGIILRFNLAFHKVEVCLYDDVLDKFWPCWFDLRRVAPYRHNEKATTEVAA